MPPPFFCIPQDSSLKRAKIIRLKSHVPLERLISWFFFFPLCTSLERTWELIRGSSKLQIGDVFYIIV